MSSACSPATSTSAGWARTALYFVDKSALKAEWVSGVVKVDERLVLTAEADDRFLRQLTAMSFNFWDGDKAAFATLNHCLLTVSKLLAPFTPFVADEIYENLDGSLPSVHLCDWPEPAPRDANLEVAMAVARETVRLGLAARGVERELAGHPRHDRITHVTYFGRSGEARRRRGDARRVDG